MIVSSTAAGATATLIMSLATGSPVGMMVMQDNMTTLYVLANAGDNDEYNLKENYNM